MPIISEPKISGSKVSRSRISGPKISGVKAGPKISGPEIPRVIISGPKCLSLKSMGLKFHDTKSLVLKYLGQNFKGDQIGLIKSIYNQDF